MAEKTPLWTDTINTIFQDLRSKNEDVRVKAAKNLRDFALDQEREMSGENFAKFMTTILSKHVFDLVNSTLIQEKIGGIMAVDCLLDIDFAENAGTKVVRLANYLRLGLASNDPTLMTLSSKALGRLARASGTLTAEFVENQTKKALELLQGDRSESRRLASVLVLKELAQNAPTLFYVHVGTFFDLIWVALRDPKVTIRESAVEALRAALDLISERETRLRSQWHTKILEEAHKGLKSSGSDSIHASLLGIGELLRNPGEFMLARFKEMCDIILRYRDHKDRLVRKTVISLLPRLATFYPELFIQNYLNMCMNYLLISLKRDSERGPAFMALGEIAVAVSAHTKPYVENIITAVKTTLSTRGGRQTSCNEALTCVSMLALAVGPLLNPHLPDLLPLMFHAGLSQPLVDALTELAVRIPNQLPNIQERLIDVLSNVLAGKPFQHPANIASRKGANTPLNQPTSNTQDSDKGLIPLALKTLGTFDFGSIQLADFTRDCIVNYLEDDNRVIRREAAITCTKLMVRPGDVAAPTRGYVAVIIGEVLEKLLIAGIADPDPSIRKTVLSSLDRRFDYHLAQAENLRSLFIALNDEVFEIRELAITVIGRLTIRNPAYVMPSLRKTLIQLLTELEFSGDSRNKEESARLLKHLVKSSQKLIKPYVEPILKALLPKLRDNSPHVASCVLAALGELAVVGGEDILPHIHELVPLIIDTLQDQSSIMKREVALRTLGQLIESTGYVISPFLKYPNLLDILLNIIKTEQNKIIRHEVIKVLGIIGALDPYKHKMNQLKLRGSRSKQESGEGKSFHDSTVLMAPSADDYYPTVSINALMKILRDPSLSTHHTMVIQAIMFIFKSLGLKCIPFLPQIMPTFLQVMRNGELSFREFLFDQLGTLVSIVKQYIRPYLSEILSLIREYWHTPLLNSIIALVEQISLALNDEFKVYLSDLIPQMLVVLHNDQTQGRKATQKILPALEVFGTNLDDYLHLVIPAMVRLFEQMEAPLAIRTSAISTLGRLCNKLNLQDYASRIVHPLARVIETCPELRKEAMDTLCALVLQLGSDYAIFVPMIKKVLTKNRIQNPTYENLVSRLLKNQPLVETSLDTDEKPTYEPNQMVDTPVGVKLKANEANLKQAWEASQRSTKEDWIEWTRRFSVELLRESPSPALRSCLPLAQVYHPLARELFNASFVSCWSELHEQYQEQLVQSLETALLSPNIPPEILQTLLNLAEFMEHDDKPLPIDIRTLGALAEKCLAYAKALHYKELEFHSNPSATIEALISINNQLQQPEAAVGILKYAQQHHSVELKESWYEKLQRYKEALEAYEKKQKDYPLSVDLTTGRMRCLHALGEWEKLAQLSQETWRTPEWPTRRTIAPLAAAAAWNLGRWDVMNEYVVSMNENTVDGTFYRAILALHNERYNDAMQHINSCRALVDTELTALVGESYDRAYNKIVLVQQLSELEEIVEFKQSQDPERKDMMKRIWRDRLKGCQRNVDTWQQILAVRSLVIPPQQDLDMWLKFASLCRKSGRLRLSHKVITNLLGEDPSTSSPADWSPKVTFAYYKQLWCAGEHEVAFKQLRAFVNTIKADPKLKARCYLTLGKWNMSLHDSLDQKAINQIMSSFSTATEYDNNWYKAWHSWALINFEAVSFYKKEGKHQQVASHLVPAVRGFFRSIALSPGQSLQDTLRLLTLWFQHGAQKEVESALQEGFNTVSIDTWLQVIPQIIARIHSPVPPVRRLIHDLLTIVGREHPQALIYPLTVASKSQSSARLAAAESLTNNMKQHSPQLVEQALMVSQELIRVAILWHEMWHEALEDASRLYFAEHNVEGMFAALEPLHKLLKQGPETLREVSFQQAYGRDLQEALEWCQKYTRSKKVSDLNQAWDLYYLVFRRINKQLPQLSTLELQYVSPKLLNARDLELAIPGTYEAGEPIIRISSFAPTLSVITSKQRPRKLTIHGSNGLDHVFLLKGHEDLRQDERVMQLFGLVNTLLASDHETSKTHLSIQRYSVIPLSPNSGLIGWVPHCDTLHSLIRDYRESRKIMLNLEHRLMVGMCSDYENLTLIEKVEVFEHALESTNGQDLNKVMWLKSGNSEVWLDRRTNYTRSLGVMSMVGYILGLGDRHPSNLMLDRHTGRILHIDFGDCFEVAMHREKYPEKIPFRLTRMLINAMEVSGIEGNFRSTCESVMRVLRENKESLMAVLEAFVYDPLINWRLLTPNSPDMSKTSNKLQTEESSSDGIAASFNRAQRLSRPGDDHHISSIGSYRAREEIATTEVLNERALSVINRVSKKLTGRDFSEETLDVSEQVEKLIAQATSHENLCQCYIGWCPFW